MGANDPLTSNINALIALANSATGEVDTNLSDAVHTLIDGYGQGGGSSWTKVCEKTYENVIGTGTSITEIEVWDTGHPELWTSDKIVYIRVRDTSGARDGYFYGSDRFSINCVPANGDTSSTSISTISGFTIKYDDYYKHTVYTTAYGIYPEKIMSDGKIRMVKRFNSQYSGTIDGNYKVEVFLLDTPNGLSLFGSDTNTGGDSGGGDSGDSGLTLTWYDGEVV